MLSPSKMSHINFQSPHTIFCDCATHVNNIFTINNTLPLYISFVMNMIMFPLVTFKNTTWKLI
jgi:hypothetical protein